MADLLVSVIVPVHDGERFLAAALESALAQDHPGLEVVVVDDGSSDRSVEIAEAYPVRLLRQPQGGVAAARNAGVAASAGDVLAFLDQDDVWLERKISRQLARLTERRLGFVLARMEIFLEPGTPQPDWLPDGWLEGGWRGVVPSALMVRRETFEAVGPFDPAYRFASDADWLARAKDAGVRWDAVDEVLVRYRIHGANENYQREPMRRELFALLQASNRRRASAAERTS